MAPARRRATPHDLREEIDALNLRIYAAVNNGVDRCGRAEARPTAQDERFLLISRQSRCRREHECC
jgi:glutathionyl-hydroquinone reductase